MSTDELTTTSYAILGLLAVKPWTTYELAKQMDRALGAFWPRTRSHLYAEPKKLVALGMATATTEATGRRPRTVYAITRKGRRALERWVPTPGSGPAIEFEQLVKVFFAEHGSRADLLATLEGARAWVEDHAAQGTDIPREYLERRGPFPERLPWLILVGKFLDELEVTVDRWAEWAIGVVEAWPDDLQNAEPDWDALEEMADRSEALARRAAARRRAAGRRRGRASAASDRSTPMLDLPVRDRPQLGDPSTSSQHKTGSFFDDGDTKWTT